MKFKKKWLVSSMLTLLFISGCSNSSLNGTKTHSSLSLPYKIVNEEVQEIKEKGYEEYTEKQTLKQVTVRKISENENERFLERMKQNTLQDLNKEYSAVEFFFGNVTKIDVNDKAVISFDSKKSNFIYDDVLLLENLYQLVSYEEDTSLLTGEKSSSNRDISYGNVYKNLKTILLIRSDLVKKGLQFKTVINGEVVYIDIE